MVIWTALDSEGNELETFERTCWDSEGLHLLALIGDLVASKGAQSEIRLYMTFQGNNNNAWINTNLGQTYENGKLSDLLGGKEFLESEEAFEQKLEEVTA